MHADVCITVKTKNQDQAQYTRGVLDGPHTRHNDMTGSDICYTQQVLDGVVPALLQVVQGNCWAIHGASGGCVTAVSLARSLLNLDHQVLAMVVDSGVPGSG